MIEKKNNILPYKILVKLAVYRVYIAGALSINHFIFWFIMINGTSLRGPDGVVTIQST